MLESKERRRRPPRPHEIPRDQTLDVAFLETAKLCNSGPRDFAHYALFRFKGQRLSGDISPVYADLDSHTISQVAMHFPETRLLLMVRDPISRVWSRIRMMPRQKFDSSLLQEPSRFRTFLEHSPGIRDFVFSNKNRGPLAQLCARSFAAVFPVG